MDRAEEEVESFAVNVKEEAAQLVASLPDDATWDDLMYRVHVRLLVDEGIADSDRDEVVDVADVRRQFGLE